MKQPKTTQEELVTIEDIIDEICDRTGWIKGKAQEKLVTTQDWKQRLQNWLDEVDLLENKEGVQGGKTVLKGTRVTLESLNKFIEQAQATQKQKLIKEVEKMKLDDRPEITDWLFMPEKETKAYNQALDEVIKLLEKKV